ncbi:hypothetical protein CDAR_297291 [Caerostris darwini]|uniref:Uncharacterized protein n=1 Tax=Caerostris darwini TaxID=1538125 RepID=A0AAV4PRV5_9ARAC|nr:hypothetical protein CDAR_297291 [Caerostris darwini]
MNEGRVNLEDKKCVEDLSRSIEEEREESSGAGNKRERRLRLCKSSLKGGWMLKLWSTSKEDNIALRWGTMVFTDNRTGSYSHETFDYER